MAVRVVEWKKPYTWGQAIDINEDKVISLRLRDENNLIIYDAWDDEIYVDLQLPDWIKPLDAFPVGVTTGRVLVADDWDKTGTIICAKTTSGDNIKLLYADDGTLYIDNGTWTFKQIYFKADVDLIISAIQSQIDALSWLGRFLSLWDGENWEPISFPLSIPYEYHTWDWYMINIVDNTTNYRPSWSEFDGNPSTTVETQATEIWDVYIYDWSNWLLQKNWWWGGSAVLFSQVLWDPYSNTNLATALNAKQWTLTAWSNITIQNDTISATDTTYTAGTNIQISASNVISATWWSDIEYKTQAEYNALLPWAASDWKHYFIYTKSWQTIYTVTGSTVVWTYTPWSFSDIQGCYLNPDGTKMYISFWNSGSGKMAQYSLSTPRDVSTASQVTSISVTKPNWFCFNWDWTYAYVAMEDSNSAIVQRYSLSTGWDISTMSLDSWQSISIASSFPINVSISENGKYIYWCLDSWTIYQYELSTAWDLTTATNQKTLSAGATKAVQIKDNWKYFYIEWRTFNGGNSTFTVTQYELATPYDITSTMTQVGTFTSSRGDPEHRALWVSNDLKYRIWSLSGSITMYEAQPM